MKLSTLSLLSLLLLLLLCVLSTELLVSWITPTHARLLANITSVPSTEWHRVGRARSTDVVRFSIALKQRNLDVLDRLLKEVSSPTHPNYRKFLSREEILDLVAPSSVSITEVLTWLTSNGVAATDIENLRDCIHVNASVAVTERLLQTQLHVFEHVAPSSSSSSFASTTDDTTRPSGIIGASITTWGESHVPDGLAPHIDLFVGLTSFPEPLVKHGVRLKAPEILYRWSSAGSSSSSSSSSDSSDSTDPAQPTPMSTQVVTYSAITSLYFYNAYAIPDRRSVVATANMTNSTLGTIGFIDEYFNSTDLAGYGTLSGFSTRFRIAPSNIIGFNNESDPGAEASLDVQSAMAVNPVPPATYWSNPTNGWIFSWAVSFSNMATVPWVVSISYGSDETRSTCDTACSSNGVTSATYYARTNVELQKLGVRGVTVIVSSGDDGVNSAWNRQCDYSGATKFRPSFPATSPYVLSVGATEVAVSQYITNTSVPFCSYSTTQLASMGYDTSVFSQSSLLACTMTGQDNAVSISRSGYTSGGGFSSVYAQPSYQQASVARYLSVAASSLPPSTYFNASMRGYPDVSMYGGTNFIMIIGGKITLQGGTSLSAPLWAGVVSLLNEVAFEFSNRTLGFINPLLYAIAQYDPSAFTDITVGDNRCTQASPCPSACVGFSTAAGWDPVTGLGTPNVARLRTIVRQVLGGQISLNTTVNGTSTTGGNTTGSRSSSSSSTGGSATWSSSTGGNSSVRTFRSNAFSMLRGSANVWSGAVMYAVSVLVASLAMSMMMVVGE